MWLWIVLAVVALASVALWRMDRTRRFGGAAPDAEEERRAGETMFERDRWRSGPGGIAGP